MAFFVPEAHWMQNQREAGSPRAALVASGKQWCAEVCGKSEASRRRGLHEIEEHNEKGFYESTSPTIPSWSTYIDLLAPNSSIPLFSTVFSIKSASILDEFFFPL